jgi:DNA invertase Pin-like site-specific DNA recombinase
MPFVHGERSRISSSFDATKQRSGLGIEARRATIARFAEAEGLTIIAEFIEAESGKGADALDRRPQLAATLAAAKSGHVS